MTSSGMQKGIKLRKIHAGRCRKMAIGENPILPLCCRQCFAEPQLCWFTELMCRDPCTFTETPDMAKDKNRSLQDFMSNARKECLFNTVCLVEQLSAHCSCNPIECDGTYKPVCGKDGHTYINDCVRRKTECLSKSLIPIKHPGPCDLSIPSPCLDKVCDHGAVCVVKNNEPVCECPEACPQTPDPVCGSDGHSYGSPCEMRAMGCALQRTIHIQHKGPCGSGSVESQVRGAGADKEARLLSGHRA
ncbi:Agrin [Larimichthys crocea]|uniref:Uncharacterized protein n=1 Tax=Larimichthys crocea TaxID=215358 RepID=A0ACD3R9M6_LARCR|nr:Agrin [Larimichthys crocea]